MCSTHGIVFQGSRFWVTHRRRRYGPFDYEWSKDFAGIELTFDGDKFGEYCGKEEIFADLKGYRLPAAVVPVATIVMGCVVYGVLNGLPETERARLIVDHLVQRGLERFAQIELEPDPHAIQAQSATTRLRSFAPFAGPSRSRDCNAETSQNFSGS